jgi:hypothetical protein
MERVYILHRNIVRIRRRRSRIINIKDSNLLSTKISQTKMNKISLLRMNPGDRNPWEKGEYYQYNIGDAKKITCTNTSLTEKTK